MPNGKLMPENHIIGEKAVRYIQNEVIPSEWVSRPMYPDYGIDLDIELFDYEDGNCVTLGEHLFLQVKGTEHLHIGEYKFKGTSISVAKFQLEVAELNLAERMGSAFPVLLVLVDLIGKTAYHICLNDYIRKVLYVNHPNFKKQKSITISIPLSNTISRDDISALQWYGKRAKIYSMFHEMITDIEDAKYMSDDDMVKHGRRFVQHYLTYDALKGQPLWDGLQQIREQLQAMSENGCLLDESVRFTQHVLGYSKDWELGTLYREPFSDEPINAYRYAQVSSVSRLGEMIKNYSGIFESCCREWFMPGCDFGVQSEE